MERISSLSAAHGRMPFDKALLLSPRIITNALADRLLEEPRAGEARQLSKPFFTRTVIAFPGAGLGFGHSLEYQSHPFTYRIDTKDFIGARGIALVFEEFEIVNEGRWKTFVPKGRPFTAERFPQESGWYEVDPRFVIPKLTDSHSPRRFISRPETGRIVPVVRSLGSSGEMKHDLSFAYRPSQRLDILVEPMGLQIPDSGIVLQFRK